MQTSQPQPHPVERGAREYETVTGARPEDALVPLRTRAPRIYETLIGSVFGGPLSGADLSRADRAIATIAALTALGGTEPQLRIHLAAARRAGVCAEELLALIEHLAVYVGYPRALNAFAVAREVLEEPRQPVGLRRLWLRDHGTEVAAVGSGRPPVVFLHAVGLDWQMWRPVLEPLAPGRRLFAYDLRGHGAAVGAASPFTMSHVTDDLVRVLDGLDLDRAHLVGLSYGGSIVLTAAARHPDRVASLALLATTAVPFEAFEGRAVAAETEGMAAQIAPTLTRWFTPGTLALNPPGVRYARERIRRADVTGWAATWRAMKGIELLDRLGDIACPTLVLSGELDLSTTPTVMRQISDRIPGARHHELPGTPHMQTLERPDLVVAALGEFLPSAD